MFRVSQHPSSEMPKTVTAASGTGHNIGTATSFQRGQVLLTSNVARSGLYFTAKSLYMFRVSQHPSSGVPKTVTADPGTGHNIGPATSFQRGQFGSMDLATLERSNWTDIMTCTGGCGYSF